MAVVATGFFDGVHLGHRRVVETLVFSARQRGEEAVVVTFAQHPRAVLQQDARNLRLLCSSEEKAALLRGLGVDRVETLSFDRAFARLTAGQYIRDILRDRLGATLLVLGYDNRLGSDRLTPDCIAPLAESLGLEVLIVPPVSGAGKNVVISSTKIREALERGDVEAANAMLGYAYALRGVVVGGKQLGRTIGFPTANLRLYDPLKIIPARGVYLTEVEVLGRHHWGMTNVGDIIETHIFDFDEDIYGLDLEIRFRRHLRPMREMESLDALKTQLAADEAACRALLGGDESLPFIK
ncbi:MAG: riboflavin biosynthesis protein RibF [Bacteroidales bacterium]|nr:riboflavin biosynthesis protein RibF [Bacteroidales bacterium]